MATTWTSSSHIRHPWFHTTIMKRKHREAVSADEELDTTFPTPRAAKTPPLKRRRKYSNLENGFAHMSLGATASAPAAASSPWASPAPLYPNVQTFISPNNLNMDADMRPSSIEPSHIKSPAYTVEEPDIPEVTMKTSSWYEPEPDRIVITDMDSFAQSDDEEGPNLTINPALLERIRTNKFETCTKPPSTSPSSTSQALVLFQPLPLSEMEKEKVKEVQAERKQEAEAKRAERERDEDAMDIEP
ncbi:hypothetical protein M413DRAFT_441869 [Hebeloma cylindrosporum]|uniref:Uncharacterized protein n=1 Tax=Hebeloma cylindrosporum TaxID=76867 RepID=A0A0C3C8N9_HEBCY|nr:hypothetical protein M413DRAFT_441869 [Hebeloma cylindrosporum h7]